MRQRRILLATMGTWGDLHPYMALALGLKARGHLAVIGTAPGYRQKVEATGLAFHPVRPDMPVTREAAAIFEELSSSLWGCMRIQRRMIVPHIQAGYEDLKEGVRGADLLIASTILIAPHLVSSKTGVPWISAVHSPAFFYATGERTAVSMFPRLAQTGAMARVARAVATGVIRMISPPWDALLQRLRERDGIAGRGAPPEFALGLFSPAYAARQGRWPEYAKITGFPLYDGSSRDSALGPELERFLSAGRAPLVFALGSTNFERSFFRDSMEAALRIKQRALFLIGNHPRSVLPDELPEGMMAVGYAPYSSVFPLAEVIVHHGGIGTTGLALHAGRPMLVVPRAHDQPVNAEHAAEAGVARVLHRGKYNASRAAAELGKLLRDPGYGLRAKELATRVRAEDGVGAACDAVEEFLKKRMK